MPNTSFLELFTLAQEEALTEREQSFVELRYGITSGEPHTLEQVSQVFSLSRERIRQVVERSLRKIKHKAQRDITKGKTTSACASLLTYIKQTCKLNEPEYLNLIIQFAQEELAFLPQQTYAFPLLISLLFNETEAKQITKDLTNIYAETIKEQVNEEKKEKLAAECNLLLSDVLWPRQVQKNPHSFQNFIDASLERSLPFEGLGKAGDFFSMKMQRDVYYRSLLEMRMLQLLEATDLVAFYQEQPFLIAEEAYGEERTYRPDILIVLKDGRGVLAEVNPWTHIVLQKNLIKYETLRTFCVKNGLGLLITDGRKTFQHIKRHPISSAFQQALLEAIAQSQTKTISWSEYQAIRDQHAASWMDFLAVVLANKLIWNLQPFTLQKNDL